MLDFRPDTVSEDYRVLSQCSGFIPKDGSYQTAYSAGASGYNTALAGDCIGARAVKNDSGTTRLFMGSAAAIQEADGAGGWTDRSRGGGYTSGTNRWWFSQGIAANEVIATNYADEMQVSTGAAFSNLTNAPKAKIVVTQSEALLAMNYNDGSAVPNGIKISDRGASTTWTAAVSNDAAAVRLVESPGAIVAGAVLNDLVVAWKRRSMYVGRFVGGDEKWQFNLLSPYVGCLGQEAWAATPAGIIFIGEAGAYIFDGSVPRPIDRGIRRALLTWNTASNSYGAKVSISHDEYNSTVYIWIPDPAGGVNFYCYAYNYLEDRWSQPYPMAGDSDLGAGTTYTDFQAIVRDYNAYDHLSLAGTDPSNVGHFIVTGQDKIVTLNVTADASRTLANTLMTTGRFRNNPDPDGYTLLKGVTAVWQSYPSGVATIGADAYEYAALDATAMASKSATMDAKKRFDLMISGHNISLDLTTTNTHCSIKDFLLKTQPAGKA